MSYSNKRQKKRSAQLRKKYHDSRAKEKEGETSKQPQKQQDRSTDSKSAVKEDSGRLHTTFNSDKSASIRDRAPADSRPDDRVPPDTRPDDGVKPDHRKYARQKLVSNWDRYEDDDDGEGGGQEEDEEELQRRLVQLLNLPTALPSETLLTEDAEQNHPDKSSFLTLDCNALAEALSSLPLHKRLDISLELLELGADTSHCSTENKTEVENFDLAAACSSKSLEKTTKQQFTFQFTHESPNSSLHKSRDVLPGTREHALGLSDATTDGDKELDKLLTADTHTQRTSSGIREVTSDYRVATDDSQLSTPTHSNTISLVGTAGDQLATPTHSTTSLVGTAGDQLAADPELDDILDELLA